MIIDPSFLSPDALDGLINDYCLRDWGLNDVEAPLETRKSQVQQALKQGKLVIQYSEEEESAHIMSADSLGLDN
ncbi:MULTISPECIES: YheU family protein [unclassified Oleiphilus]|uniref:YheU family protein n=1 Tax=unclassified Oleiphilus TaxID=2631174 RepID=UPI0007C257FE|nr:MULTISPECIES: YheU family protein [unclassified Oleiphilus]KZY47450.1 hypothetical protein A3732_06675 [Oleiphilus sp. HI0050]KZY79333.1 hypothetical protein A3740_07085 [Oleiphilus sp. HI0068]KZY84524.1 hypothetical protein A3741_03210 [Oleiphilus sp. HI0069]KZY86001.1 hypothetical protein A3743_17995 [Oleiphilus sp. HI0072]KZZ16337.1 hypothetical protein A3749_23580 [Oleiphilus sp. HI0078]KZZ21579.1 hypothetical protein A3752_00085 [Oleiphilus sp. HI0081]KZZ47380.1 hypothetical protein 